MTLVAPHPISMVSRPKQVLSRGALALIVGIPSFVVVLMLAVTVWLGFADKMNEFPGVLSLNNYRRLFADPQILGALINTVGFTITTVITALAFGIISAWLVERTDMPGKKIVYSLMTIGLLLPTFFLAMGWLFFMHPRIGMMNTWMRELFGIENAFNIASVTGMGWVEGLGLSSLVFVMMSPVLRALNPALEEAASVHGLRGAARFFRITLPLTWPGLAGAAIYIGVIAIATFEVPAIIGMGSKIFTFSTIVYLNVSPDQGVPNYGVVGALSLLMIVLSSGLSWWYFSIIKLSHKYEVVAGKQYRPKLVELGHWVWLAWFFLGSFFFFSKLLPFLIMIWASVLPYFQPLSIHAFSQMTWDNFRKLPAALMWRGAENSLLLMVFVPTVSLLIGLFFSWVVVRSRARFRFLLDWVAFLPHAVPNIIFAVSGMIIGLFLAPKWLPLYGTIYIIAIVYIVIRISLTTRVLNSAIVQVHRELEEVSRVSGLTRMTTARKVLIPLLAPALINLWMWNALLTFRELTVAAFLVTHSNVTLPVVVWGIWQSGGLSQAAAMSLVFVMMFLPIVVIYWFVAARSAGVRHTA
ncbi:MAG TPA: ABC transporter permease subunit [Alphaproteobacteria bacterium]|jgi:iron(III) transport system permease protein